MSEDLVYSGPQEASIPAVDEGQGVPSAHTPGPWKACGSIYEHMCAEVRSGDKGQGQPIAQVWDGPNGFKDALLMAAAPGLLGALENLLAAFSAPDERMCCDGRECACMGATVQQEAEHYARAAIARATGEA